MINAMKKQITENRNLTIRFSSVAGHSGNVGNELADENAKEAANKREEVFYPITKAFISKELYLKFGNDWK